MKKISVILVVLAAALTAACQKFDTPGVASQSVRILGRDCTEIVAVYPEMEGCLVEAVYLLDAPADGDVGAVHFVTVFQKRDVKPQIHAWVKYEHGFLSDAVVLRYEEHIILYTEGQTFSPDQVRIPLSGAVATIRRMGLDSDDAQTVTLCRPRGHASPQYRYGNHLIDAGTGTVKPLR